MLQKKICIIYNFAQHYRTSIFRLLDRTFECSFYFGASYLDIKKMDYNLLAGDVHEVPTIKISHFKYRKGILGLLRKKYDAYIILGESRVVSTWLFLLLSRLYPQKKVYSWTHGWTGKEKGIIKILDKIFLKLPNGGNFLYGNYARNLIIEEGLDPQKQFVVHNSLAYEEQLEMRKRLKQLPIYTEHFGNDYPNLMFIGRLTRIKKLDQTLRAMSHLKDKGQLYNITFIGGGETQEELQKLATKLGLEKNVWFYGPCYDESELSGLIYNADLCVSPGNVGLTAMHTMVFGTPVLTHDDFPHQMPEFEAIHAGETGAFFKIDDVESLAEGISKWFFEKGDKREEVRRACMNEIDENWTPYFQIKVFKKVLCQ